MPIKRQSLPSDIFLSVFTRMHLQTKQANSEFSKREAALLLNIYCRPTTPLEKYPT